MAILSSSFYAYNTARVAKNLLGSHLIRIYKGSIISGIIVETEAYSALNDPACHAFNRRTLSNEALYGPVGCAYIYFIYGNHYCFNIVAHSQTQVAGGVLIRALEPVQGINYMEHFRKTTVLKNLTNGPGKLTQALHITKEFYGTNISEKGDLYVIKGRAVAREHIKATTRIGITKATETLWRFYIKGNMFVSKY